MKHIWSFSQGFGRHDCVLQNNPNHPGLHWHVKSVPSLLGIHLPLPQSTFSHIVAVSQKNPENPVGHAQLIMEPFMIEHVAPFWQILTDEGHGTLVPGGLTLKFKSQKGPFNNYFHSVTWY